MNYRYLFRGKRTDNGDWVEGLLGRYSTQFECANIIDEFECLVPVKTETVGQYTGLTDYALPGQRMPALDYTEPVFA